jgi:hypothetical protein
VSLDPALAAHAVAAAGDAVATLDHSAKVTSWNRLGMSLELLAAHDGQPSGVVAVVLRPLGEAAVEFLAPQGGGA